MILNDELNDWVKNKEKYPLGLLVITDLKVSKEKVSSFK